MSMSVLSPNAMTILKDRYLKPGESPDDMWWRVARHVALAEKPEAREEWASKFHSMMAGLLVLPNSPTLVNAGTGAGCLSACFVVSPNDSMEEIMECAKNWALIEKWGGGVGCSVSAIRPKGDSIRTTHGKALGPLGVLSILSHQAALITQGSFRLGAHMAMMDASHPDIMDFIKAKDDDASIQNFNISVQVTDRFMKAVEWDEDWRLVNPKGGQVVRVMKARELWKTLCESAWRTGDPGICFIDRVQETQPNPQLGNIVASNPCSEQFLEDFGSCNLASIDLSKLVSEGKTRIDYDEFDRLIRLAVRFLDDVVEVNEFPLDKLREMNLKTRRIGLGVMGWADCLARLGVAYSSETALRMAEELSANLTSIAWEASGVLAREKGPFPEWERSKVRGWLSYPVRNSDVTSIQPTGTVSRIAGCSSGIEPYFALVVKSNVLWGAEGARAVLYDGPTPIMDALGWGSEGQGALRRLFEAGKERQKSVLREMRIDPGLYLGAMEIDPDVHVKMQAAWQQGVTNGISKTVNLPHSAGVEQVERVFKLAWETRCKSVTIYRDGSKSMQVLEASMGLKEAPKGIVEEEVQGHRIKRTRPITMVGVTEQINTGHGHTYVTVNHDDQGRPFEVFTTVGKAGSCDAANLEAVSRLASLALRSGVPAEEVVDQLQGITCHPVWDKGVQVRSTPDALAQVLKRYRNGGKSGHDGHNEGHNEGNNNEEQGRDEGVSGVEVRVEQICPKCSGPVAYQEGCVICLHCAWNQCGS